ncbi:MAG: hypothetical protein K8R87_02060 [Verrucomicrobia bacterium]|nr:hypothetical protein [Verrucomicrobiota bacterium]
MNPILITHLGYLALCIPLTVWVAKTLHKNGRVFLVDSFHGNKDLADSVNHLLVVGFYLINLGFVGLYIRNGARPADLTGVIEETSVKVGTVTLVLGVMHLFNLYVFNKIRRRAMLPGMPPPLPADGQIALP